MAQRHIEFTVTARVNGDTGEHGPATERFGEQLADLAVAQVGCDKDAGITSEPQRNWRGKFEGERTYTIDVRAEIPGDIGTDQAANAERVGAYTQEMADRICSLAGVTSAATIKSWASGLARS